MSGKSEEMQPLMEVDDAEKEELAEMSEEELVARTRHLQNTIRERQEEEKRLKREINAARELVKDNEGKIAMGKQLPFMVSTVVELVPDCEAGIEDALNTGAASTAGKARAAKSPATEDKGKNGLMPLKKKTLEEEREELEDEISGGRA